MIGQKIKGFIKELRIRAWTKNLFLFGAILFANKFTDKNLLLINIAGFFIFCFLSGAVYLFNDILDYELDKKDPKKCKRPIAAGIISKESAFIFWIFLSSTSLFFSAIISLKFLLITGIYFVLNIFYSVYLKRIVLVDVTIIALGFTLRALAGALLINVEPSNWFLITTFFLANLLACSKRRYEFIYFKDHPLNDKKRVLGDYDEKLLDQLISISATGALLSYSIYTIAGASSNNLVYTIPFVLYGIFRYLFIVYKKGEGGDPDKILLNDIHILSTVTLFGIVVALLLIYY